MVVFLCFIFRGVTGCTRYQWASACEQSIRWVTKALLPWRSVMAPPHSSGIWNLKVDGTVTVVLIPTTELKKYASPRGWSHFWTAVKEFPPYGGKPECSVNSLRKSGLCRRIKPRRLMCLFRNLSWFPFLDFIGDS